jgi:WD40 repeat protein
MPDALRRAVVVPLISHDEAADPGIIGPHLALDYVHGYNGDISARNAIHHNAHSSVSQKNNPNRLNRNIFWLNDYVILFPAATIVVAMSVFEQSSSSAVGSSRDDYLPQQFFTHHTDEVTALAVHRGDASATLTSTLVASGQTGKVGKVFIWNPAKVLDTFDRHFRSGAPPISNGCSQNVSRSAIIREIELSPDCRGIHSLSFSPDGIILLVMGLDEGRTMYLYNSVPQGSENEFLLAKIRLGYTDISYVGFNDHLYIPFGTSDSSYGKDKKNSSNHDRILESGGGCYTITSCRSKSVKFWTLHQYRELAQGVVEVSGFKGRRVLLPKRLQQWTTKYSLVGGTSFLPRGRNNIRLNDTDFEITCCCVVKDSEGLGTALPTARTLTGTSTGAVFVWRQEEATEIDDIYSIILGGNKSHGRAHRGRANENPNPLDIMNAGIFWKPKGVFLYVITDLHDGGIIDIDHWTRDGSSQGLLLTTGRDRTINMWTMSKKDQNGIPVDHVNTFRLVANSSATTVQDSQLGLESLGDREDGASQSALDASIGGVGTSISISPDGNHAIVGSTGNCIFLMSKLSGGEKDSSMMCIHRCHVGSASRIALHPEGDLYLTTSSDKTVRIWSALRKRQLGLIYAREQVSCGAFSIDGHVALGLGALGSMLIFRLNEDKDGALTPTLVLRKNIVSAKSKQPGGREPSPPRNSNGRNPKSNSDEKRDTEITDMSYSPSGSVLAVALSSGRIYLLSAEVLFEFEVRSFSCLIIFFAGKV